MFELHYYSDYYIRQDYYHDITAFITHSHISIAITLITIATITLLQYYHYIYDD